MYVDAAQTCSPRPRPQGRFEPRTNQIAWRGRAPKAFSIVTTLHPSPISTTVRIMRFTWNRACYSIAPFACLLTCAWCTSLLFVVNQGRTGVSGGALDAWPGAGLPASAA